ncbi:carbonic anhydrase [Yunchengibacter salinarum]|uniref:carbonic anhydrase n=1 Tax=Yunchengibacter salinarum TaxID=3133399 RepID=UPI0035B6AB8B
MPVFSFMLKTAQHATPEQPTLTAVLAGVALALMGALTVDPPATAQDRALKGGVPDWTYQDGDTGPRAWGGMDPVWRMCTLGNRQSPIDITATDPVQIAPLSTDFRKSTLNLGNNGRALHWTVQKGSRLMVGENIFTLDRVRFQAPAEHLMNGVRAPAEIQMRFSNQFDRIAMLSILVDVGSAHEGMARLLDQAPLEPGMAHAAGPSITLHPNQFLPDDLSYVRYLGSLTTPPCTQGVNWYVLTTMISFSLEQVDELIALIGNGYRPVQPRGDRMVLQSVPRQ